MFDLFFCLPDDSGHKYATARYALVPLFPFTRSPIAFTTDQTSTERIRRPRVKSGLSPMAIAFQQMPGRTSVNLPLT